MTFSTDKQALELRCVVHPERPATKYLAVPCAPNGKLPVCDECGNGSEESLKRTFNAYRSKNGKRIQAFTQRNPNS